MSQENNLIQCEEMSSTFFPKFRREANTKPNILFIMTDQQRYDYIGCAGNDKVDTPNMDKIAARGVRFTNCYTNAPVCTPARISLATGLHPSRMGVTDNASYYPQNVETYYQRLRDNNYHVGLVGKLDFTKPSRYNGIDGDRPSMYTIGFTRPIECEGKVHAYSAFSASDDRTPIGPYTKYLAENGQLDALLEAKKNHRVLKSAKDFAAATDDYPIEAEYTEDAFIAKESINWIKSMTGEYPWHLFVSFVGPHYPFDPPTSYADMYRDKEMDKPIESDISNKPKWVQKKKVGFDAEQTDVARRQYCASLKLIDDQIGELLQTLEDEGYADNTYVILSSDHGDMLGDHGLFLKRFGYEGALRIPLLVYGPGIEGGRVCHTMTELMDINPTICEMAGIKPKQEINAKSFMPVLLNETEEHRDNIVSEIGQFRLIRTQKYKMIDNVNDITELYDMENDPEEKNNIADQNPTLVKDLKLKMKERYIEGKCIY